MPVGAAGGNERLQIAAGALGQGLNADGDQNSAARAAFERTVLREIGSCVSSHCKYQLPVDGFPLDYFATGDDRAFLSGLDSGIGDRFAAVRGIHMLNFKFLSGGATRALSKDLEAGDSLSAVRDGRGNRAFDSQCGGRA